MLKYHYSREEDEGKNPVEKLEWTCLFMPHGNETK